MQTATMKSRTSANDVYAHATGTDHYYKYSFGHTLTDGTMSLATDYGAFWIMDLIASW